MVRLQERVWYVRPLRFVVCDLVFGDFLNKQGC